MKRHTYDSLRELAVLAVTTPSLEAEVAMAVLADELEDAGVLLPWGEPTAFGGGEEHRERAAAHVRKWVGRWAMKATYGASVVMTILKDLQGVMVIAEHKEKLTDLERRDRAHLDKHHRDWTELRIALRRRALPFHGSMTREQIEAMYKMPERW